MQVYYPEVEKKKATKGKKKKKKTTKSQENTIKILKTQQLPVTNSLYMGNKSAIIVEGEVYRATGS